MLVAVGFLYVFWLGFLNVCMAITKANHKVITKIREAKKNSKA